MKALCLGMALVFSSPALAGGAIGGSTGAKCFDHLLMNAKEFRQLVYDALTRGWVIVHGENMRVEALNIDEQTIELSPLDNEQTFNTVWTIEVIE